MGHWIKNHKTWTAIITVIGLISSIITIIEFPSWVEAVLPHNPSSVALVTTPYLTAVTTANPTSSLTPNPTLVSTVNPTSIPTSTPTLVPTANPTPAPTPYPTPRSSNNPTVVPSTIQDLVIYDGIYTSGYGTAVLGQEFDGYYLVQNKGVSPFSFQAMRLSINSSDGTRIYDEGRVNNVSGSIDNTPLQPNEYREVYIKWDQFGSGCGNCSAGEYRMFAQVIMPNGSRQDITQVIQPHTGQLNIKVCTVGMQSTPNRCP